MSYKNDNYYMTGNLLLKFKLMTWSLFTVSSGSRSCFNFSHQLFLRFGMHSHFHLLIKQLYYYTNRSGMMNYNMRIMSLKSRAKRMLIKESEC